MGKTSAQTPAQQLLDLIDSPPMPEQEAEAKRVSREVLMTRARELDASVRPGKHISMREIVKEVRIVRQRR